MCRGALVLGLLKPAQVRRPAVSGLAELAPAAVLRLAAVLRRV